MTAPSGSSLEIDYYLERVRVALQDLPEDVRDDLLEDLPAHFAEVLAEQGGSLVDRLGPPAEREDPAPVRFAQRVGLVFLAVATAGYLGGATALGVTATALGLAAG